MASMTIRLDVDPASGKRTITIAYQSEADALPHEHEEEHRQLVNKLFEKGLASAGDKIVVARESAPVVAPSPGEKQQEREAVAQKG